MRSNGKMVQDIKSRGGTRDVKKIRTRGYPWINPQRVGNGY